MRTEYDGFQIVNQIELLPALLSSKEFDLYRSMKTTVLDQYTDPALRNDGGSYCTALWLATCSARDWRLGVCVIQLSTVIGRGIRSSLRI